MKKNILKLIFICITLTIPCLSFGEIVSVEKVNVQIQPLKNNEFQLFIKFDLPELPQNANIDYVVLNMGMNVMSNPDSAMLVFEVLSKNNTAREKIVKYNSNPVTAIISGKTIGLTEIQLNLTQLVDLWIKDGEKNDGIFLVSHRGIKAKCLNSNRIKLDSKQIKSIVKIFYTIIE